MKCHWVTIKRTQKQRSFMFRKMTSGMCSVARDLVMWPSHIENTFLWEKYGDSIENALSRVIMDYNSHQYTGSRTTKMVLWVWLYIPLLSSPFFTFASSTESYRLATDKNGKPWSNPKKTWQSHSNPREFQKAHTLLSYHIMKVFSKLVESGFSPSPPSLP